MGGDCSPGTGDKPRRALAARNYPPLIVGAPDEPVHPELADVWHRALNHLSPALPKDAYETWIKPTTLVVLEDGLAVVGTPNIFVRQEVEQCYKAHLEAALSQVCDRPIVLQAVIGQ